MRMTKEELSVYIKKELNKYKKPENKNENFILSLMEKAEKFPSSEWNIWAPTKKLKYAFEIVEAKLESQKWLKAYEDKTESLDIVVNLCYELCLEREGKPNHTVDTLKLQQWQNTFAHILEEFNNKFSSIVKRSEEWDALPMEVKNEMINDLVAKNPFKLKF